jgi:DNA polymerase-3 subunit alpha
VTKEFTHLHVHSHYSSLDGAAKIKDIVSTVKADGAKAIALTDHGVMQGILDLYKECREQDIKPIIGEEFYFVEDRFERPEKARKSTQDDTGGESSEGKKMYYHLTVLAENQTGYQNIKRLSTEAFLNFYRKPLIDFELLEKYHEGLIATTGCLGGIVLQQLLKGDFDGALAYAARFQEIFGKDNLFVELQDHNLPEQKRTNPMLIELAKQLDAPLVACQDSHYCHKADAEIHDSLLCIQTRTTVDDPDRFKFHGTNHYLRTANEMWNLFGDTPEACSNTLLIAERSNVELELGKLHVPKFPVPEKYNSADEYLRALTFSGAKKRYGTLTDDVISRLEYELKTIADLRFSDYFLVVWDLMKYCRENDLPRGPGRGSCGGALTAYCLDITRLDPLLYGIPFERFLNPDRPSYPDIDIDISPLRRDELIHYTADKYGSDHVAQVVTYSKIGARAAVRDSARVLGLPYEFGNELSKAMPPSLFGRSAPIKACLEYDSKWDDYWHEAQPLRDMYATDPQAKRVIDIAKGLDGLIRQDGIHASAIALADVPLIDILPLQRKPQGKIKAEDAPIVTQFDMHGIEDLGILKLDFLGLRNLDVIDMAVRTIDEDIDINSIPLNDMRTFELLRNGETTGLFQIESAPMKALLKRLRPTSFDDIAALVALYRPGPMAANWHNDYADRKNHRQEITSFHEEALELLKDTYALPIFQEQIAEIARHFAGYSVPQSYTLIKIIGKKLPDEMAKEKDKFISGCETSGYGRHFGEDLFKDIEKFASYGYNKSHSYLYGFITYQTAWLKANYPVEYMAALLESVRDDREKSGVYIGECRRMGIKVTNPDVNTSQISYFPSRASQSLSVGLNGLSGIGDALASKIVLERNTGAYESISDFCIRNLPNKLTRTSLISLIKAGALDCFGQPRKGMIEVVDEILKQARRRRKEEEKGTLSLFDASTFSEEIEVPQVEFTPYQKLQAEQEVIGLFISAHPLDEYRDILQDTNQLIDVDTVELPTKQYNMGTRLQVGALIKHVRKLRTKRGDNMANVTLDDGYTERDVVVFPKSYANIKHILKDNTIGIFTLSVSTDKRPQAEPGTRTVAVEDMEQIVSASETEISEPLRIYVPKWAVSDDATLAKLRGVLLAHRGPQPVHLHASKSSFTALDESYRVSVTDELVEDLRKLFS